MAGAGDCVCSAHPARDAPELTEYMTPDLQGAQELQVHLCVSCCFLIISLLSNKYNIIT